MANSTLESLFREPKSRVTDREAFIQAITRLSGNRSKKGEPALRPRKGEADPGEIRDQVIFI